MQPGWVEQYGQQMRRRDLLNAGLMAGAAAGIAGAFGARMANAEARTWTSASC
jgi:hypothetical protein